MRSCTDCYPYPGERIVETIGAIPGHLIHFLSDSQSVAPWYLHILRSSDVAVLESSDLYGLKIENSHWIENPSCSLERVDIQGLPFVYCAATFLEFNVCAARYFRYTRKSPQFFRIEKRR